MTFWTMTNINLHHTKIPTHSRLSGKLALIFGILLYSTILNAAHATQPAVLCQKQDKTNHKASHKKHQPKRGNKQKPTFNYTLCSLPNNKSSTQHLKLYWWHATKKQPFYTFAKLKTHLAKQKQTLHFAMNAGMYDDKYAPLALYVENGKRFKTLNLKKGGGNFHLLPNGVFWLDRASKAHVTESHAYKQLSPKARFATQSGPMLVIDGRLHPKFQKNSPSRKMRNGVGICQTTDAAGNKVESIKFVISDEWVNFYHFTHLFKYTLGCKNALFLDGGRASALYSKPLKRHDRKYMGVIIGISQANAP